MYKFFLKRVIDFIVALLTLPFLMIVICIVGIAIYFEDKGPVFYTSFRLGKDGRFFKMYKLRSMKVNALDVRNEDGSTFNSFNDDRLTKIGVFIRKTSLDEIPQLINVIKGDMSLVGPRPDMPEAKEIYTLEESRKLEVRPGITGYNQAFFRNSVNLKEKFKNDIYYVENVSLVLDIKVVLKTVETVIMRKNIFTSHNQ